MSDSFTFTFRTAHIDRREVRRNRGLEENKGRVQRFIDSETLRLCTPYVPMAIGELIRSGLEHTVIGNGEVKYDTPYARRWYYKKAKFTGAPKRGNYWFERMKNEGGKKEILKGARKIAGAK